MDSDNSVTDCADPGRRHLLNLPREREGTLACSVIRVGSEKMARLPRITAAQLMRALHRDGRTVDRQRGSHAVLVHPTKPGRVVVPVHAGEIIKPGILQGVLADAGLTADDLRALL